VHHAPRFLVLLGGLLLLGAGTASLSTIDSPALAAPPIVGAIAPLRQAAEPAVMALDPTGTAADPADDPAAAEVRAEPDDPVPPHPGATDRTLAWVAPDGSTGPGVAAIFRVFGQSDGLTWALRVAHCESHYDPGAVNQASGATGLFQFMPSTWNGYFAGWNIWDPVSQAQAALAFYQRGWTDQWECR
jgi:soluble lytic murein transglycosylase-like protein